MYLKFCKGEHMKTEDSSTITEKLTYLIAEFLGTGMLLFIGCTGSVVLEYEFILEKPLAFGLGVMVAMQCIQHLSGGHVNPIVTMSAVLVGQTTLLDSVFYIIGQFLGAIFGYSLIWTSITDRFLKEFNNVTGDYRALCVGVVNPAISEVQGLFMEFSCSFILMMVICAIWDYRNKYRTDSTPLRFGLGYCGLIISSGPFTGGHMNPARTLAPAILNNFWDKHYVYWGGALGGGLVGAIFYSIMFMENEHRIPLTHRKSYEEMVLQETEVARM